MVKGRCGVLAGYTVWSTPEHLRGEVLTTRHYTNRSTTFFYLLVLQNGSSRMFALFTVQSTMTRHWTGLCEYVMFLWHSGSSQTTELFIHWAVALVAGLNLTLGLHIMFLWLLLLFYMLMSYYLGHRSYARISYDSRKISTRRFSQENSISQDWCKMCKSPFANYNTAVSN